MDQEKIFNDILAGIKTDTDKRMFKKLLLKAIEYTSIRAKWEVMTMEERSDTDELRTMTHDSLIGCFNQLSRLFEKEGIPTEWRDELGDDRKVIGDFANYLVYKTAVRNR